MYTHIHRLNEFLSSKGELLSSIVPTQFCMEFHNSTYHRLSWLFAFLFLPVFQWKRSNLTFLLSVNIAVLGIKIVLNKQLLSEENHEVNKSNTHLRIDLCPWELIAQREKQTHKEIFRIKDGHAYNRGLLRLLMEHRGVT